MKKIVIIVAAVVVLLLVAAVLLPVLVDANKFRPMIESEMQKALGRDVHIGDLKLSVFAGGVTASDISIGDDPAFSRNPFVKAKSLDVGVEMMPLIFSRALHVRSLTVNEPEVALLRNAAGKWNYSTLGSKEAKKSGGPSSSGADFSVGELAIKKGQISVASVPSRGKPHVYEDVNLTVKDLSTTSVMPFSLDAKTPGGGTMKASGQAGPLGQGDMSAAPVKADLEVKHMDLASTGFVDPSTGMSGVLDFTGKLESDGKTAHSDGKATVDKLHLVKAGAPAQRPVSFDYATEYDYKREAGSLTKGDIHTGKSTARLSGTYDTKGASPSVHMKMNAPHLPVDDIEALLPAFGVALPSGASLRGGTLDADLSLDGPIDRLVTTGPVTISNTTLAGYNLASKMSALSALAGLKGGSDTQIQTLASKLRVSPDGIQASDLNLIVPAIGTVTGNGTISPANALNFKMAAKLANSSMLGGITQIASFGQKNGMVPFRIEGTTSNPIFIPDVAGAMGGAVTAPAQGVGGVLGGFFGKKK